MQITKVFKSGNSMAIRIPKEMQPSESEYFIQKIGECYYIQPIRDPWLILKQTLGAVDEDITFERDQPFISELPVREDLQ